MEFFSMMEETPRVFFENHSSIFFFFFVFSCCFGFSPCEFNFVKNKPTKLLLALKEVQRVFFPTIFPLLLILLLLLFWLFWIYGILYKKKSWWAFLGAKRSLISFFSTSPQSLPTKIFLTLKKRLGKLFFEIFLIRTPSLHKTNPVSFSWH